MNTKQDKLVNSVDPMIQKIEELRADLDKEIERLRSVGLSHRCADSLAMRIAADAAKQAMTGVYFAMQSYSHAARDQFVKLDDTAESN